MGSEKKDWEQDPPPNVKRNPPFSPCLFFPMPSWIFAFPPLFLMGPCGKRDVFLNYRCLLRAGRKMLGAVYPLLLPILFFINSLVEMSLFLSIGTPRRSLSFLWLFFPPCLFFRNSPPPFLTRTAGRTRRNALERRAFPDGKIGGFFSSSSL